MLFPSNIEDGVLGDAIRMDITEGLVFANACQATDC